MRQLQNATPYVFDDRALAAAADGIDRILGHGLSAEAT